MRGGEIPIRNQPSAVVGRFVLPLDRRTVVDHYRTCLHVAHARGDRLRCLFPWRFPFRRNPLSLPGPGGPSAESALDASPIESSIDRFCEVLGDNGQEILKDTALGSLRELDWILLTDRGDGRYDRIVAFVFSPGSRFPAALLKLHPLSGEGPGLHRESEALAFLARRLSTTMRPQVPATLAFRRFSASEALLQTYLPGRSLYVDLSRRLAPRLHVRRHLEMAAHWLARFHLSTRSPDRFLGVSRYEQSCGETPWLEKLRKLLAEAPLPLAASHGDFWPGNFLRPAGCGFRSANAENVGVVDWEAFSSEASPHEDLLFFPLSYGLNYPWSKYRRQAALNAFRLTFLENNPVSRAVRSYFQIYSSLTGLRWALLEPILHCYLLTRSVEAPSSDIPWLGCQKLLAGARRSVLSG